jgi:hypothetical protein
MVVLLPFLDWRRPGGVDSGFGDIASRLLEIRLTISLARTFQP